MMAASRVTNGGARNEDGTFEKRLQDAITIDVFYANRKPNTEGQTAGRTRSSPSRKLKKPASQEAGMMSF